jgi:hypothetical protein
VYHEAAQNRPSTVSTLMNGRHIWAPAAGFAGYLLDLARFAKGAPANLHSLTKYRVIRALARRSGGTCLIETGTFLGVTAARCARVFDTVLTVELDAQLAARATKLLAKFHNVTVYQGDAVALLPQMLAHPRAGKAVVFLDAHHCGGISARGDVPEPALAELDILGRYRDRIAAIVIDDFRCFGVEDGFPTKAQLLAAVEAHFPYPNFAITALCDQIVVERAGHA